MQFKYYENYKIIRLILITWLVSVSRRHLFALYKKRARQTIGKEDKIVWRLFCFKFCMSRASDKFQSANLHAKLFPAQTFINYR